MMYLDCFSPKRNASVFLFCWGNTDTHPGIISWGQGHTSNAVLQRPLGNFEMNEGFWGFVNLSLCTERKNDPVCSPRRLPQLTVL